jgi:hypothetical protein
MNIEFAQWVTAVIMDTNVCVAVSLQHIKQLASPHDWNFMAGIPVY